MNSSGGTDYPGNVKLSFNVCELEPLKSLNPWCGKFGGQQIFELIYLSIVMFVGTFGNFIVIASILYEKRIHKHGNIFIVNLAIADLIVCGLFMPTVAANVVHTGNSLPVLACKAVGFILIVTAVCSVANLMLIAINRYWSVVHVGSYDKYFSKQRVFIMVSCSWVWSFLISSPTLFGWSNVTYDFRMMGCAWDDEASLYFNIFFMACSNFIPVMVIIFCYWKLFSNVKRRGKWLRQLSVTPGSNRSVVANQISIEREIHLLRTLAISVVVFVLCWVPYVFCVLINPKVHHQAKKIFGWLGLTNSALNFIIYGLFNPVYRRGYKNFFRFMLCKRSRTSFKSANSPRKSVTKYVPPHHISSRTTNTSQKKSEGQLSCSTETVQERHSKAEDDVAII